MFKRFCMGQNLRAMFNVHEIPPELHSIIEDYEDTFRADIRGTFINDDLAFNELFQKQAQNVTWSITDETPLSKNILTMLRRWISDRDPSVSKDTTTRSAFLRKKIGRLGQLFQTSHASLGDSNVVFGTGDDSWSAGVINSIFSHIRYGPDGSQKTDTFLVIDEYAHLSPHDATADHFRDFAPAGRLFYRKFTGQQVLVNIDDVTCHFGSSELDIPEISSPCIHTLPLAKVCLPVRITFFSLLMWMI